MIACGCHLSHLSLLFHVAFERHCSWRWRSCKSSFIRLYPRACPCTTNFFLGNCSICSHKLDNDF
ncbi:hypothetical protein M758_9G123800 [Ceratodon purpureus]|uniref:Uncharacterized protein n=1 Tax=Ceratodon purpureus TaxID=3225 RepID=A0A8T0GSM8_CERPU|nr:hypothetical protein KC19_9G108900 [Ceratodon purpureus]KAG0606226.1 hypothetical protein M758_9G123800 [Ceratodon purpureus]